MEKPGAASPRMNRAAPDLRESRFRQVALSRTLVIVPGVECHSSSDRMAEGADRRRLRLARKTNLAACIVASNDDSTDCYSISIVTVTRSA
jgi:hypothetical protein